MFELCLCWIIYVQSLTLEGLWAWYGASLIVWKPIFSIRSIYRTSRWCGRHLVWSQSSEVTQICIIIWGIWQNIRAFFVEKHESIHLKTFLEGNFKSTEEQMLASFSELLMMYLKYWLSVCVYIKQSNCAKVKKGRMPQLALHHLFYRQSLWNLLVFRRKQTVIIGCFAAPLQQEKEEKACGAQWLHQILDTVRALTPPELNVWEVLQLWATLDKSIPPP